jgi:hypothetical protein
MVSVFFGALLSLPSPAQAQLVGGDTTPGTACSTEDSMRMTANPTGTGGYILTCEGGVWVATLNTALPTANAQAANKEYVDNALASGGLGACVDDDTALCALETNRASDDPDFTPANIVSGVNILGVTGTAVMGLSGPAGCATIGALCADGTVFAGWHPITQEILYIPTVDQQRPGAPGTFTMRWKNAFGTNDINPDSINDGKVNHANRGGAIGDFQAFQACVNLNVGGHTDWYLPSQVELYYLWSVRTTIEAAGNITNFQNANYWSSTENSTNVAWLQYFSGGFQVGDNKTTAHRVRCVRR